MMVRMLVGLAGPSISLDPGDEADFPPAEAMRLVQAGFAVMAQGQVERATVQPARERLKKNTPQG